MYLLTNICKFVFHFQYIKISFLCIYLSISLSMYNCIFLSMYLLSIYMFFIFLTEQITSFIKRNHLSSVNIVFNKLSNTDKGIYIKRERKNNIYFRYIFKKRVYYRVTIPFTTKPLLAEIPYLYCDWFKT